MRYMMLVGGASASCWHLYTQQKTHAERCPCNRLVVNREINCSPTTLNSIDIGGICDESNMTKVDESSRSAETTILKSKLMKYRTSIIF